MPAFDEASCWCASTPPSPERAAALVASSPPRRRRRGPAGLAAAARRRRAAGAPASALLLGPARARALRLPLLRRAGAGDGSRRPSGAAPGPRPPQRALRLRQRRPLAAGVLRQAPLDRASRRRTLVRRTLEAEGLEPSEEADRGGESSRCGAGPPRSCAPSWAPAAQRSGPSCRSCSSSGGAVLRGSIDLMAEPAIGAADRDRLQDRPARRGPRRPSAPAATRSSGCSTRSPPPRRPAPSRCGSATSSSSGRQEPVLSELGPDELRLARAELEQRVARDRRGALRGHRPSPTGRSATTARPGAGSAAARPASRRQPQPRKEPPGRPAARVPARGAPPARRAAAPSARPRPRRARRRSS